MSKCLRSVVAFVVGIVLLAGLAGATVGQTAVTWPMTIDVSGMVRVAVVMQNTSPVAVNGVSVVAPGVSGSSSWRLLSVGVYHIDSSGNCGQSTYYNHYGYGALGLSAESANESIAPGAVFVVLITFNDTALNDTRLLISPEVYCYDDWAGWGFYPIAFSGSQ